MNNGARQSRCAQVLGLSVRTLNRWRKDQQAGRTDGRPTAVRPAPANALSAQERAAVLAACNRPENASLPPAQIVASLADENCYIASEATFYRVLKAADQQHHRGRARAPRAGKTKSTHTADRRNQVWAWDITWLPSTIAGIFFKLYIIIDLYSRKIVADEVWAEENAAHSEHLLRRAYLSENIAANQHPLVLHGDNGSPLKAGTVLALMQTLGITPSHSRPRVSNDNPHIEALFRTTKYHPSMPPKGFASVQEARQWVSRFVQWYNREHRHSALRMVTPAQKHAQEDVQILDKRKQLYEAAKANNPRRWIQNKTRDWTPVVSSTLNPVNNRNLEKELKKTA
jgi:transposase InsO family protein